MWIWPRSSRSIRSWTPRCARAAVAAAWSGCASRGNFPRAATRTINILSGAQTTGFRRSTGDIPPAWITPSPWMQCQWHFHSLKSGGRKAGRCPGWARRPAPKRRRWPRNLASRSIRTRMAASPASTNDIGPRCSHAKTGCCMTRMKKPSTATRRTPGCGRPSRPRASARRFPRAFWKSAGSRNSSPSKSRSRRPSSRRSSARSWGSWRSAGSF